MQAAIASIREELKDHYPSAEIEGLIRFLFTVWKQYTVTDLLTKREERLSSGDRHFLSGVIKRLKEQEPIQYILGEAEFFGLPFFVTPDVLIPRPETEELVDWVLKSNANPAPVIIDMGTGSGCIGISLKKNLPGASVTGCDLSENALRVARRNAKRHQTDIDFIRQDLFNPRLPHSFPRADTLVSNPPYVTEKEKKQMEKNVIHFEPHSALFVPDHDPLKFYRALISFGKRCLKDGGRQFWEINEAYSRECFSLLKDHGFNNIELRRDIHGKERMISGQYRG
ncbi:MAG: peptide chain release factor N(5)-glutamine methyltransferase [Mangrovibacterium sp.]|nr:peptide chain release factor N(5)-glutamine methyltransferase [Mangrovibacterium sp.]